MEVNKPCLTGPGLVLASLKVMNEGHASPGSQRHTKGVGASDLEDHWPPARCISLLPAQWHSPALPFLKQDGLLHALGVSSPRGRDQI